MLPAPLPDLDGLDPETLKALLIAKHNEWVEQHKQLRSNSQEIEHLKLVIEKYRRMIFGRKSEKLTRELEQFQLRLEELETTQARDQAAEVSADQEGQLMIVPAPHWSQNSCLRSVPRLPTKLVMTYPFRHV